MSRLISQIMLAILLFPLAGLLYFITFVLYVESQGPWSRSNTNAGFIFACFITWIFISLCWIGLWRNSVRWTSERVTMTSACYFVSAVIGAILGAAVYAVEDELGFFVGTVASPLLWQVGAVLVWRESAAERAARVGTGGGTAIVCPTCGYNMTGLKSTRCPECGSEFTIDQLFAQQPGRAQVELES